VCTARGLLKGLIVVYCWGWGLLLWGLEVVLYELLYTAMKLERVAACYDVGCVAGNMLSCYL